MADYIIPSFIDFPVEGAIVGRILAGYGELELELANASLLLLETSTT